MTRPEEEKEALVQIFQEQGCPKKDAHKLQEIVSRDPGRWVGALLKGLGADAP